MTIYILTKYTAMKRSITNKAQTTYISLHFHQSGQLLLAPKSSGIMNLNEGIKYHENNLMLSRKKNSSARQGKCAGK